MGVGQVIARGERRGCPGCSIDALLQMVTDIAPALAARGAVTVHEYGGDVMLRLNGFGLMSLHVDTGGGWLVAQPRKVFEQLP